MKSKLGVKYGISFEMTSGKYLVLEFTVVAQ